MVTVFILSIIISTIISLVVTPQVRNYFISRNWVEDPQVKQKKTFNATALSSVPRGGGVGIFISIFLTSLLLLSIDKHFIGIFLAAFITLVVGLVDDVYDISPKIRLFTNILSAAIVVGSGIGVAYISNPFGGTIDLSVFQTSFNFFGPHSIWIVSDLLAILWIVWCMNITGWSAGVEGQLPGFIVISSLFIGILGLRFSSDNSQISLIIISGAVAGAYLGFLPFNFYPQSIMPGYSGKSLAGFFLALLSILSGAKIATLFLLLAVPMIDAVFVLFRRWANHRPLLRSDGHHLHHTLLKIGWTRPQISVFYWAMSFSVGCISLFLSSFQKLLAITTFFIVYFVATRLLYRHT